MSGQQGSDSNGKGSYNYPSGKISPIHEDAYERYENLRSRAGLPGASVSRSQAQRSEDVAEMTHHKTGRSDEVNPDDKPSVFKTAKEMGANVVTALRDTMTNLGATNKSRDEELREDRERMEKRVEEIKQAKGSERHEPKEEPSDRMPSDAQFGESEATRDDQDESSSPSQRMTNQTTDSQTAGEDIKEKAEEGVSSAAERSRELTAQTEDEAEDKLAKARACADSTWETVQDQTQEAKAYAEEWAAAAKEHTKNAAEMVVPAADAGAEKVQEATSGRKASDASTHVEGEGQQA